MAAKARSWDWAAQRLWSEDTKCNVRLLDTVLLDAEGRPQRWLFASKHGHVAKKKDDHVSLSSIRDRFARFSAHPKNVLRHTAYAFYRSGKRELLDATQFSSLLDALDGPPKHRPSLAGLVAYVHSSSEHALAEYRANNGVSLSSFDGAGRARKEMERATLDVVSFLQTTAHVSIAKLGAEFVVDDDNVVWLSHLPQMLVEVAPGTQSLPSLAKTDAPSSVKCAGEFCRYSDADLPGLYATPPLTPLPLADTGQRTKIGYNNILLARAAMGYLLSRSDDAAGWDALDAAQRAELGQSNPSHFYKQVGVCPNCHTIYAQLQALRHNRFSHEIDRPTSSTKKKVTRKLKSNSSNVSNNSSNNQQPQPSDSLLKFMGVAKPSADAHEAAFLAELHRQSQLLEPLSTSAASSARLPEDDAASTTEAPSVVKRKSKKGPPRPKDNQVLAQFEAEWSAVESANKSLVAENARLTARLADVEAARQQEQVQWATDRAQLLESNEVLERQTKALGKRLSALQKEFSDAMAAKDNEWTRRLLETEQLYSARSTPPPSREVASGNQLSLIETIEQLSAQLEAEQREREMDRQRLAATHQADVQRVHDRLQLETEALRIGHRQQLDTIEELKTQLLTTSHQLQVAQAQTKQAKAAALDAQVAVSTLEDKLVALEAKSLPPALLPTTAAVDSAANEKLQHKIEYLKAQLASETRCKEELGATVATLTANLDSLKRDRKKLSSDLDEAHRKQLEKADARYRAEVETVQAANAALQSKMATLQANVADLVADLAASRNKEESAKLSMEKLASESVRLHARMAELEATNEELQEAANGTKSSLEDAQRATMEATLRRLTHERQYLKSQMDGEIRRKDDAEAKVRELQAQLADATTSTKAEVIAAKQVAKDKETALSTALAKLEETQLLTQGELSSTKHQLHDAKIALIGARDESQRARAELETQRADLAHLKTSLLSTREELLKERDRSKLNAERQSASLQAIKASLVETEASKAAEITALHNERTQLRSALAEAQSTRLALAASLQAQSVQQKQQVALLRVALSTAHREATRVLIRWEGWTRHVACHRVQESGAQKLKEALQAREVVWHDRLSVACADVHEKCTLEKDLALAAVSERLLTDAADAARAAASAHTQALAYVHYWRVLQADAGAGTARSHRRPRWS
ncbi:hypothetical protein SPRG_01263 [Saprolegnia parasitica CBS 223.65]|uniref:Uncharacterized protein n=1 Tax=Saprolegnia parasitica (strain CBS 223.65) TaxID=695850 RepID=A0A067CTF3_SAPPC|nr:hypothetical protein SPRG_01263 [Saprolegnia parasitica CBS 223.65]KDO33989.1 hypothetical protein SPRG_01263 [Saprolegnia parasitica CBS 223.65]|eukprot:XP_012194875.1 hypothetical protein SPRG_01263 [Saprolegnia parasitica CBS 223.65]